MASRLYSAVGTYKTIQTIEILILFFITESRIAIDDLQAIPKLGLIRTDRDFFEISCDGSTLHKCCKIAHSLIAFSRVATVVMTMLAWC